MGRMTFEAEGTGRVKLIFRDISSALSLLSSKLLILKKLSLPYYPDI